jgi:8-oxo-dGTP diphosphatase
MKKTFDVVAAVIVKDNKVFCAQRGPGRALEGKWEFPGGKIENNETHQQALIREIKEELNSEIEVNDFIICSYYEYETFNIYLHAYYCNIINGNLELTEHTNKIWISISLMNTLDWAPADLPIVNKIKEDYNIKTISIKI